jgi:peptidoglycan hydrolase CwlO-like protein
MTSTNSPNGDSPFGNMRLKLDPQKEREFFAIVQEKYDGDLHAALRRAIEYFLMCEKSRNLKQVSETLREIQGKISRIREMSAQISDAMKSINETNARIKEAQEARELKNGTIPKSLGL